MARKYRVTRGHRAPCGEPLRAPAGMKLELELRDTRHPGWAWATAVDGREGWVPLAWVRAEGEFAFLTRDHDATELTVEPGDVLDAILVESGWVFAEAPLRRQGWVPLEHLEPLEGP